MGVGNGAVFFASESDKVSLVLFPSESVLTTFCLLRHPFNNILFRPSPLSTRKSQNTFTSNSRRLENYTLSFRTSTSSRRLSQKSKKGEEEGNLNRLTRTACLLLQSVQLAPPMDQSLLPLLPLLPLSLLHHQPTFLLPLLFEALHPTLSNLLRFVLLLHLPLPHLQLLRFQL